MPARHVLTSQSADFPQWYQDVLAKAELADNGPVRGTMVIRPYGYAIWERMQAEIDARIKAAGVENAYFPLFIPESYLRLEATHVEGFSPELAVVTHGGGKKLEEPVVVRPTSETIINAYFAKWVQSYRDLPMLINQWANVVRWELRPRLFLRTTEFLWQEGHTAHASESDARRFALEILHRVYEEFMVDVLAIPVMTGLKTARERFSGAVSTWTCEAMMRDGKALQMGTSHELGQNFAQVFGTTFLDETGEQTYVWQTSWGVSTRLMGALVMAHGDDQGLRVPPRVAAVQAVVLVVRDEHGVRDAAREVSDRLARYGVRTRLDDRTEPAWGRRVVDWELKGVPVRVEIGPRELEEGRVVLARRDTGTKTDVPTEGIEKAVRDALDEAQGAMFAEAQRRRDAATAQVSSVDEAEEAARSGFAVVPWRAVGEDGEARLNEAGVSVRLLMRPDRSLPDDPRHAQDDDPASDLVAVVARAY
jgi:prolyl-tRNA synthetase